MTTGVSLKKPIQTDTTSTVAITAAPANAPAAIATEVLGIRKNHTKSAPPMSAQSYKIASAVHYNKDVQRESMRRAIDRLRSEHPKMLKLAFLTDLFIHLSANGWRSDEFSSQKPTEDNLLEYCLKKTKRGLCAGTNDALWEMATRTKKNFSGEMLEQITSDDVCYGQLKHTVHKAITVGLKTSLASCLQRNHAPDIERFFQSQHPASKTDEFSLTAPATTYQDHFTQLAGPTPTNVLGSIDMYSHRFPFQWTKDGLFLYDPYSKETGGLFKLPNEKLFFEKLRSLAIHDVGPLPKDHDPKCGVVQLSIYDPVNGTSVSKQTVQKCIALSNVLHRDIRRCLREAEQTPMGVLNVTLDSLQGRLSEIAVLLGVYDGRKEVDKEIEEDFQDLSRDFECLQTRVHILAAKQIAKFNEKYNLSFANKKRF